MGRYLIIRKLVRPVAIAAVFGAGLFAVAQNTAAAATVSPVTLASAKFPNLTRAERAMLEFADKRNIARGEFAIAGISAAPLDLSKDPAHAGEWNHDREIRASLIRWLCVDPDAVKMIDPKGIRILGGRIVETLDLSNVRVPFGLTLRRCLIPEPMNLSLAELASLDLGGSLVSEIDAQAIDVRGDVDMDNGFRSSGLVRFEGARIDGDLNCAGGSFTHSAVSEKAFWAALTPALILSWTRVGGTAFLCCGFRSDGAVMFDEANLRNLLCFGGHFINPGKNALDVDATNISGYAVLGQWIAFGRKWDGLEAEGPVVFVDTKVGEFFRAEGARFLGKSGERHGLIALGMSAQGAIVLVDIDLRNGALLDLRNASTTALVDNEQSWPVPGKLMIDGFTYRGLYDGHAATPSDAHSRLRWIRLQATFNPQPYRQLAGVLHTRGDDAGAQQVLIEEEDLRYARYGFIGRMWGGFLKWTIGYGHRPLLTILWSFVVVVIGWAIVAIAKRTGVMRLTWPETTPLPAGNPTAGLHPLLYSLDVFLPFVNLHQEHYWWPDESASGEYSFFGRNIIIRGSILRYYLWLQIIAGWLLSAIFVAGVTGLMRND